MCVLLTDRVTHVPQESHLLVFFLIVPDDLGGGHAHLDAIDNKLPRSLQGLTREVLRKGGGTKVTKNYVRLNLCLHLCTCITTCI